MEKILKIAGLLLVLLGVVILIVLAFTGNVNNNLLLSLPVIIMIAGIVSHILINKYLVK